LLALRDAFLGWPPEVNEYYQKGRDVYIAEMDLVIDRVATVVETGLKEAVEIIADGKRQVEEEVARLPEDERTVGEEAARGIEDNLKRGLLEWLFGEMAEAGFQLPAQFDLAGILSLVLQVLGLTYANIRRRAVKLVGEKVVSALETGAEIFKILIVKGAVGLW